MQSTPTEAVSGVSKFTAEGEDASWINNEGIVCVEKPNCELCGSVGAPASEDMRDRLFGAKGVWRFARCTNQKCGLVWIQPHPRVDQIIKFYATYYTHGQDEDPAKPHADPQKGKKWARKALTAALFWRAHALRSDLRYLEQQTPGKLLEVGCGDGYFLADAARHGWDVYGNDFDEVAIARARANGLDQVQVGDLTQANYPADAFDAVVMSNVLEHLPNPIETLQECRRVLKPGGRLISITPNSDSLGRKLFGVDWRGWEPPRHLFIYNNSSSKVLARRTGFTRSDVFCTASGSASYKLFSTSIKLARDAKREPPVSEQNMRRYIQFEQAASVAGFGVGEWVVLIGYKD
jgi:SAM-dependent methyltransferase